MFAHWSGYKNCYLSPTIQFPFTTRVIQMFWASARKKSHFSCGTTTYKTRRTDSHFCLSLCTGEDYTKMKDMRQIIFSPSSFIFLFLVKSLCWCYLAIVLNLLSSSSPAKLVYYTNTKVYLGRQRLQLRGKRERSSKNASTDLEIKTSKSRKM